MVEKWGVGNFFSFSRSVVDRARSLTAVWNGDSQADWEGLAFSVASGIRAGLLLFSTWGSDIGGYTRPDETTPGEELWARWMQFGAFSPHYVSCDNPAAMHYFFFFFLTFEPAGNHGWRWSHPVV